MAYESTEIFSSSNFTGNYRILSGARDQDGVLYALFYDDYATGRNKSCRFYKSLGEGRSGTWQAESWSQSVGSEGNGDGGTDPHLFLQPDGSLWVAMSTWDGVAYPHVLQRDEDQQEWGARGRYFIGFVQLQNYHSNVASFSAGADPFYRTGAVWNIACCYITTTSPSGEIYYIDLAWPTPQKIHSASDYVECKMITGTNGWKMAILLDSSDDLWSVVISGYGSSVVFANRTQIDSGVSTIEDVTVRMDGTAAITYRKLVGGIWNLQFAEYNTFLQLWSSQRVWDGTNDLSLQPGQSVAYDQKGSVFIVGPGEVSVSPSDPDEMIIWELLRGVDPQETDWSYTKVTSGSTALVKDSFIFNSVNPMLMGFMPQRPIQGLVFLYLSYPAGGDEGVTFANRDQLDDPSTTYPTRLQQFGGEPFFRLADDKTRTSKVLQVEGAAGSGGTIPYVPSYTYVEEATFRVAEQRFEAGYSAQILRFAEGRKLYTLNFKNLGTTEIQALKTFFSNRQVDGKTVTLDVPDESSGTQAELIVTPTPISITKEHGGPSDDSIWSLTVQLTEQV